MPAYALIGGRTLTATAISLATAALLLLAGGNIYDVAIPNHALPAVAITIILGSITFSALAYALAPSIRSSTAIQPVITLILLPLYAISGVLLPNSKNPDWLNQIASALPLQHLAHALHHAFDPTTHGLGISPIDLAILAAWALAALTLAASTIHLATTHHPSNLKVHPRQATPYALRDRIRETQRNPADALTISARADDQQAVLR